MRVAHFRFGEIQRKIMKKHEYVGSKYENCCYNTDVGVLNAKYIFPFYMPCHIYVVQLADVLDHIY